MWVVVLDDGQTFSGIDGCSVLWIPPSEQWGGEDQYVKDNAKTKGISLAITESVSAPLSGDIYIPNLTEIEG